MKEAELVDSRWAYQGNRVQLRLDTYRKDARIRIMEVVHHPGAVVIIPIDAKKNILFAQQWRHAVQRILLELPAGTLEEKEDPLFCAQRELQEETGFRAGKLTGLGGFFCSPGFCDEYLHLFLGEDLLPSPLAPDEDEVIEVVPLSLPKAIQAIEEGKIVDAKSIAGIFRYKLLQ